MKITGDGSGTGNGVVKTQSGLSPALNCTITAGTAPAAGCQAKYPPYTSFVFTATPAPGYAFTGWGGVCSGTGTCEHSHHSGGDGHRQLYRRRRSASPSRALGTEAEP